MPDFDTFHINEARLEEVLRVKDSEINSLILPVKIPTNVGYTIEPEERLTVTDWFNFLFKKERWSNQH